MSDTIFYAQNLETLSKWKCTSIDNTTTNRIGWIGLECTDPGNDINLSVGSDMGIDADWFYQSGIWDFSKNPF
jgi:hypothetical protein